MAHIGSTCSPIGSPDWYIGDHLVFYPTLGEIFPGSAHVGVGQVARIEANKALSTDELDPNLTFTWRIIRAPNKSVRYIESRDNYALLTLDQEGIYGISCVGLHANGGCTATGYSILISQPFEVASEPLQMYDVSWIWALLPDFWENINTFDKQKVETLWRGLSQLLASDIMSTLNAKDALSIATIQDRNFRKWLGIDLVLPLQDLQFKISDKTSSVLNPTRTEIPIDQELVKSRNISYAGTLLVNKTVLLEGRNLVDQDIGALIQIWVGGVVHRTRIMGSSPIGERTGGIIRDSFPRDTKDPTECRVVIEVPAVNEVGLFVLGGLSARAQSILGDGGLNEIRTQDLFTSPQSGTLRISHQIKLIGAEQSAVSAGDTIQCAVCDEFNRKYVVHLSVKACIGDYISIEDVPLATTLKQILSYFEDEDLLDDIYEQILSELTSSRWKHAHIGGGSRNSQHYEFGVGTSLYRRYRVDFTKIIRRKKIPVSRDLRSIITITERTERAQISDGTLITESGQAISISREPLFLRESLDFYLRIPEDRVPNLRSENDTIISDYFDFTFAGIEPGCRIRIESASNNQTYLIKSINKTVLTLTETVAPSFSRGIGFLDVRDEVRSADAYIIFDDQLPSDVEYLWAETVIYDNHQTLEDHFGALAGIRYSNWALRGMQNTYKDALLGLLYARTMQPSLGIIETAVSILAGTPFVTTESKIIEINDRYILDEAGNPLTARVMLQERVGGSLVERYSNFLIPVERPDRNSEYTGLAFNDEEGRRYSVGDIVSDMTQIAMGTKIYDLYSTIHRFPLDNIKDRHKFVVSIDVDSSKIRTQDTLSLIYDFVVEIKPAYTHFIMNLHKYVVDDIVIEDDVFFRVQSRLFDNPYHHRGPANVLDDVYPDIAEQDLPVLMPLTTWFPQDGQFVRSGSTYTLTSATGGFIDPSDKINPFLDQPWIQVGDYVIERKSQNVFTIDSIDSDTQLTLSTYVFKNHTRLLDGQTLANQPFFVGRARQDVIFDNTINFAQDVRFDFTNLGDRANDIGIGDKLSVQSIGLFTITNKFRVSDNEYLYETYPRLTGSAPPERVQVFREQIVDRVLFSGSVTLHSGEKSTVNLGVSPLSLGVEPGDIIEFEDHTAIVTASLNTFVLGFSPAITHANASTESIKIYRSNTNAGHDDLDEHERGIQSSVQFILRRQGQYKFTVTNGIISDPSSLLSPGDVLYNIDENTTYDYGEGSGILRVVARKTDLSQRLFYTTYSSSYTINNGNFLIIRQAPLRHTYYASDRQFNGLYQWGEEHWRLIHGN